MALNICSNCSNVFIGHSIYHEKRCIARCIKCNQLINGLWIDHKKKCNKYKKIKKNKVTFLDDIDTIIIDYAYCPQQNTLSYIMSITDFSLTTTDL